MAVALGAGAGLTATRCVLLGAAFLSGQLSIGWLNDLLDLERDAAAGRQDKPVARGDVAAATVRLAMAVAAITCVPLSLALGWRAGLTHLAAVGGGWTYDLRLKTTPLSPVPYAVSFGLLPSVVTLALPDPGWAPWWATTAGALLGVGIHGANALPDIDDDVRLGAAGLPARLGARTTRLLSAAVLLAATAVLVLGPGADPWSWVAFGVSVALAGAAVGRSWPAAARTPFGLVIVLALVDVGVLVARAGDWAASVGTLRR